MKTLRLLALILLWATAPCYTNAQRENNIWAFGDSLGLDFSSGSPAVIATNILSGESGASICNPEGRLLFYCGTYQPTLSRGRNIIWDSTGKVMPNSDSLIGNMYTSSSQGVTILPFLDGSNKYYVFLQASRENLWEQKDHYLRYSVVDMDLRAGLGDVMAGYKNIIIDSFISEKLAITLGPDCSVWLLSHRSDTNVFHAFKIDAGGISTTAIVSGFPSVRYFSDSVRKENPYALGNMDVSTDGRFIAAASYYAPYVIELFDFNKNTGVVSNARTIDSVFSYWLQFSPDGNKLYTSSPLAQYNLSLLPSLSAVKASKYLLPDTIGTAGMRIGPDNKIYYVDREAGLDFYLHRIEAPDLAAPACGVTNVMKLKTCRNGFTGLGPRIIVPPPTDTVSYKKDTALCFTPAATLAAPAGYRDYVWQDGTRGRFYTSLSAGKSWVRMRKGCTIRIDTFYTLSKALDTASSKKDTTICFSRPVILTARAGRAHRWQDGTTGSTKTISTGGLYWVSYYNEDCGFYTDTFLVHSSVEFDTSYHITDTTACMATPLTLSVSSGYEHQQWEDGSTAATRTVSVAGLYRAISYRNCSVRIDSFYIKATPVDTSFFQTDTIVCFASRMSVQAPAGFTNYLWNDGSTGRDNELGPQTIKWVAAYNQDCKVRIDTFEASFIDFNASLPEKDSICGTATLLLDVATPNASYLWQDGSTAPQYTVTKEGDYSVSVQVGPCVARYHTRIGKKEFLISLGADQEVCEGSPVRLEPEPLHTGTYQWQNGSAGNGFDVTESGVYWLEVATEKCMASDTVRIEFKRCHQCIAIPNAFTPDKNGRNDVFRPLLQCPVLDYQLKIFNRYGQEVFNARNPATEWDGTFAGNELDLGVYYYFLKVLFDYPGSKEEIFKGDISLIR